MKIVLLVALVGLALSQPISYEYRYSANVATGAIELSNRLAGIELVADVRVTISGDKKRATIQIVNPMVGNWIGPVPLGRTPLPVHLGPMSDAKQIEKPFVVIFSSSTERLLVPSDDTLWMVNLRKGIASTLRVPYVFSTPGRSFDDLSQNRISSSVQFPTSYQKFEETMHGKCLVRYTVSHATGSRSVSNEYRLVKSIDLNACQELIVLTKSSTGNLTSVGEGQSRGVQSRSSVGTYVLKGSPSSRFSATVKEAVIEGMVTLNPLGINTKKLISITNQTLTLTKSNVREGASEPRMEDLKPELWTFRMESPHTKSNKSPSWISFLNNNDVTYPIYPVKDMLGFPLTTQLRHQIKDDIKNWVNYIVEEMPKVNKLTDPNNYIYGTLDGQMVRNITRVVKYLRKLTFSDLEQLFHDVAEQAVYETDEAKSLKRDVLINAYKSAGSSSAFKVLIKQVKENKLSEMQAIHVFTCMNAGAYDPIMVSELIAYAKTLPENRNIMLKSAVLINLSTLVRRMCVLESPREFVFPKPVFGASQCVDQVSPFVKYLISQLEKSTKPSSRAIYIQSLANLGDMEGLEILAQVAKGFKYSTDKNMQLLAINGLTKNHLKNSSYEFTREILISIVEAQQYAPEVREAALVSLFTLPQNATMWHRVASITWTDTSDRVPMFIRSYIKAVSESGNPHFIHKINIARHVLPLTKKYKLIPLTSHYWSVRNYCISKDMAYQLELFDSVRHSSESPLVIKSRFLVVLGGLKFPIVHSSSIVKSMKPVLLQSVKKMFAGTMGSEFTKSIQYRQAVTHLENLEGSEQLHHITWFKDIESFVPVTGEYLLELLHSEQSSMGRLFNKLRHNKQSHSLLYTNLVDEFEFIPSDVGVPIITSIYRPLFAYQGIRSHVKQEARSNKIQIEGKSITKLVFGNEAALTMLVPWMNQSIGAEVYGETSFNMATKFSAELDTSKNDAKHFDYNIQMLDEQQKTVPVAVTYVQPFISIAPLFETVESRRLCEPIVDTRDISTQTWRPFVNLIDISVNVMGDINKERVLSSTPMDVLSAVTSGVTIDPYQVVVDIHFFNISGRMVYADVPKQISQQQMAMLDSVMPMIEDMSVEDTVDRRMQSIRRSPVTKMVSASMRTEGSRIPMKFEFVALLSPQEIVRKQPFSLKKFNIQMGILKSNAQTRSSQVCVRCSMRMPVVESSRRLSQLMSNSMPLEIITKIFSGESCRPSDQDLIVKAKVEMSQERRRRLADQASEVAAVKPVYDSLIVEVEKMKNLDPIIEEIISETHSIFNPAWWQTSMIPKGSSKIAMFTGERSLWSNLVTLRMQSAFGVGVKTSIRVPSIVDALAPVAAL